MNDILPLVVDRFNEGVILLDEDLKIRLWNNWLENYSGVQAFAVTGKKLGDLYPLFNRNIYMSFFREALEQGKSMFFSGAMHPVFIPPGKKTGVKQNMQIESLHDGRAVYILIQINDITNQHKRVQLLKREIAERRQVEGELLIKSKAIESSINAVAFADLNGSLYYINNSFLELWGYTEKSQVLGRHVAEFWHDEREPEKVLCILITRQSWQGELIAKKQDGSLMYLNVAATLVKDDNGNPVSLMASFIDISEQKKATEELKELYENLDREINKARKIHENILLDQIPSAKGISIAAFNQPAERLGGDFFDVRVKDGKMMIYLSDVSGHGLDGAMMSVFVKNTIEDYFLLKPVSAITPENILRYLSAKYHRENYPPDYFICLFLVVLDLNTGDLQFNGLGFQALPKAVIGGQPQELTSAGLPISTVYSPDLIDFQDKTVNISSGATILFTTDGLTEQINHDEFYYRRLDNLFYQKHHLKPEQLVQIINEDFCEFNNGRSKADDDITFLILQAEPH